MGNKLEFRTTLELSYQLNNDDRIGFSLGHISNANIGNKNPGVEINVNEEGKPTEKVFGRRRHNWLKSFNLIFNHLDLTRYSFPKFIRDEIVKKLIS